MRRSPVSDRRLSMRSNRVDYLALNRSNRSSFPQRAVAIRALNGDCVLRSGTTAASIRHGGRVYRRTSWTVAATEGLARPLLLRRMRVSNKSNLKVGLASERAPQEERQRTRANEAPQYLGRCLRE